MAESGDAALIDAFCDALWLEHGLSKNTLEAYRRDLTSAAIWLSEHGRGLLLATEEDLRRYIHARHASTKPSSANRRMSALRRFYRLALRNQQIKLDPTVHAWHRPNSPSVFPRP
jgi:integrase/recombinase XerD